MDKWFDNKNVIRIISIAIGILLWVVVHLDEEAAPDRRVATPTYNEKVISDVSIKRIGLDSSRYQLVAIEPDSVRVTVRGPAQEVDGQFKEGTVIADLSNVKAGTQTIALESAGFPEGFQVTITPLLVKVTVEEIQSKEVPVTVDVTGQPEEGFTVGTAVTTPRRVYVTAPESQLKRITGARVTVDITGRDTALNGDYKVEAVNAQGEVLQAAIQPAIVNVEVPITSPFSTVPLQLQFSGETPEGYAVASYKMSVNEVTIYGADDVLEPYEFYEGPTLDLSRLNASTSYTLNIPAREGIEQILPNTVNVEIEVVASVERTLEALPITVIGNNDAYRTSIVNPQEGLLDVTVEGAPELIGNLTAENVQLVVDVSNLPAGTHEVPLRGSLPTFMKWDESFPSTVTIEISSREDDDTDATVDPDEEGTADDAQPDDEEASTDESVEIESNETDDSETVTDDAPTTNESEDTVADENEDATADAETPDEQVQGETERESSASLFVPQQVMEPQAFSR